MADTGSGVIIMGASNILLQNLTILGDISAPGFGVDAINGASVSVLFSTVSGNMGGGVRALGNSTLTFGGTISSPSGSMVGPAVAAVRSSSVRMQSVSTVTGPDNNPTILADQNSTVSIGAGNTISTSSASTAGPAIVALRSSSVRMESQSDVTGPANNPTIVADQNSTIFIDPGTAIFMSSPSTAGPAIVALKSSSVTLDGASMNGPSNNHTILAAQASSVLLHETNAIAATPFVGANPFAVITATGSSSVVLAGGNTITNNAPAPAAAVIVSDGSSFIAVNGTRFGFTPGLETINGDGRINTQSVIELATPSGFLLGVDWTGNIVVSQASSFKADGGSVTINGTLTLGQAANGYFNQQNGTTNNITHVVCRSTTDHVTNPTFVTPNITIGPPPGCALF